MKTRIVRVGNSPCIRIPKPLLDQAGLCREVDLRAEPGRIIITPATRPRADWAEAAAAARAYRDGTLLDAPVLTRFDVMEWEW
ncbi:MAG TPA: hypothetical protein VFS33_02450 [Gemmatimonadales bacterium]|nr:hypothetical protein [Gemmatimonadales bacterium]